MKPKFLFHGSGTLIRSTHLKINQPKDKSEKENNLLGVYATDRKDIAIAMSLTTEKYTRSFGDYHQTPFQAIFVRGQPKKKFVYLYKVSSKNFTEQPKGSHQWVSPKHAKIIERTRLPVKDLEQYWRLATKKEKDWFYAQIKKQ